MSTYTVRIAHPRCSVDVYKFDSRSEAENFLSAALESSPRGTAGLIFPA